MIHAWLNCLIGSPKRLPSSQSHRYFEAVNEMCSTARPDDPRGA